MPLPHSHPDHHHHQDMIGPPPSFYDPWEYQQQQQSHPQQQPQRLDHSDFDFAFAAPGASYDELLAQFYPQQVYAGTSANSNSLSAGLGTNAANSLSTGLGTTAANSSSAGLATTASNTTARPKPNTATNGNGNATGNSPPAPKRKRAAKKAAPAPVQQQGYSDSDSDDDGFSGGISVGMGGLGVRSKGARLPGACTHCKKLKMKCDFGPAPGGVKDALDNTCRRCRAGGHVCIVEGRKPRSAPNPICIGSVVVPSRVARFGTCKSIGVAASSYLARLRSAFGRRRQPLWRVAVQAMCFRRVDSYRGHLSRGWRRRMTALVALCSVFPSFRSFFLFFSLSFRLSVFSSSVSLMFLRRPWSPRRRIPLIYLPPYLC
ncbi:hypothetical protein B0H15DRAFT_346070 [Mycena belliarum]|uniref:Zn(2)-C6 fungal-type domain-containing protein n=1 Tax=Mycena belliarum TaxID=1033014 RepID=A0AAD6XL88_9AGAR|nr:hypothetical protein B0H15DRAFT_346070 [Mycena belliae]